MTVNTSNQEIIIHIGPQGVGSALVDFLPGQIEMVRVVGPHGHPHVLQSADPTKALIEVLGALPDSEASVTFYVE